jgi:hypothetical protein
MIYLAALFVVAITTTVAGEKLLITEQQRTAMKQAAAFRTFIINGETLSGRLAGFATTPGQIKLQRTDGSKSEFPFSAFSEKDQAFIQDWQTGYSRLADNELRIAVKKKIDDSKEFSGDRVSWVPMFPNMKYNDHWCAEKGATDYDEITYEFRLENMGTQTLSGVCIDYCVYHQTTIEEKYMVTRYTTEYGLTSGGWVGNPNEGSNYPEQTVSNIVKGTLFFQDIAAHNKAAEMTAPLNLVEKSREMATYQPASPKVGDSGTRNTRTIKGELLGIRYRVYVPTQGGSYALLEVSNPNNLTARTIWPEE